MMQGPLRLPGRRMLLTAQGSLHRVYCRTQPTVEVKTSWLQTHMRQRGVRSYANSSIDNKEMKHEGSRESDQVMLEKMLSSPDLCTPNQKPTFPLEAQDLPEIPPLPARPTFHISPKDITTYIRPLVSRRWKIGHIYTGRDEDEILALKRRYEFKGFRSVMDFVQGVADISGKENHHGRIVLQYNTVDIISHTHSAFTLHHVENGDSKLEKVPGLTRRDIRFAIKIEELYESFKEQGCTPQSVPAALGLLQRQSMYSVLRKYGEERIVAKTEDGQSTSTSNAMEFQREASLNAATVAVKTYQGDNNKRNITTEAAPKFTRRDRRALENLFLG